MSGKKSKTRYRILLHALIPKEVSALPVADRKRLNSEISELAFIPVPVGATRVKGRVNAYRIRVGDYRVVYEVHVTEIVIYFVGVAHRREVYRRILQRSGFYDGFR